MLSESEHCRPAHPRLPVRTVNTRDVCVGYVLLPGYAVARTSSDSRVAVSSGSASDRSQLTEGGEDEARVSAIWRTSQATTM
jgi:hypothetical protein